MADNYDDNLTREFCAAIEATAPGDLEMIPESYVGHGEPEDLGYPDPSYSQPQAGNGGPPSQQQPPSSVADAFRPKKALRPQKQLNPQRRLHKVAKRKKAGKRYNPIWRYLRQVIDRANWLSYQHGGIASFTEDVEDNWNKLVTLALPSLDSIITGNAGNITTNTTNIDTNTTNISTNTGNISTNTSNISTNTGDISTNTSNISTNTTDIGTNTTAISSHTSSISTLTSTMQWKSASFTYTDFSAAASNFELDLGINLAVGEAIIAVCFDLDTVFNDAGGDTYAFTFGWLSNSITGSHSVGTGGSTGKRKVEDHFPDSSPWWCDADTNSGSAVDLAVDLSSTGGTNLDQLTQGAGQVHYLITAAPA